MKYFLFIIMLSVGTRQVVFSVSHDSIKSFLKAKQLLKEGSTLADTSLILQARDILLAIHQKEKTKHTLYFIAQAECELVRLGMAFEKSSLFERFYDSSVARSEQLTEQDPAWSEPYALLSILYGYKISRNPVNAMTLGPKSYFLAEDAIKLNENNPRAWFVAGIVRLHMPGLFGGGANKAIPAFEKAIEIFENEAKSDTLAPEWGYLDALTWLGWALEKNRQPQEALDTYKKALFYEPRATWISSVFIEPLRERKGSN